MEKKSAMDVFMEQQAIPEAPLEMTEELETDNYLQDEEILNKEELEKSGGGMRQENVLPREKIDQLLTAPSTGEQDQTLVAKPVSRAFKSKKYKSKRSYSMPNISPPPAPKPIQFSKIKTSEQLQLEKEAIKVRETGFWFWRRIIVPPNAYVIHTRINRKKPVSMGLGISFKYIPNKDAYMVIPASIQTIGVVANCISKEKQGINILAYVQWQISDLEIAYRKLDFSDTRDPLGIVNAQLREQAEAAVKDKIATMSVEEVLTDKAPVIEELTTRLKEVTEGRMSEKDSSDQGLGIKVITVQIREALVSSQSLWRDLQSPFRYQKEQAARISHLEMQQAITHKEMETRMKTETEEAETRMQIEIMKQKNNTEALEMRLKEEETRFKKEQETMQRKMAMEEQTSLVKVESKERLLAKENELRLNKELQMIKQEEQNAEEAARISLEASKRKLTLETEEKIQRIIEETRLAVTKIEKSMEKMAKEKSLKEEEASLAKMIQQHQDTLNELVLKAKLARDEAEHKLRLEISEMDNAQDHHYEEQRIKLEKARQEVHNLINQQDLASRLIKQLPKIAAEMPEIKELRVLQDSMDNSPGTEQLTGFLSRLLTLFDSFALTLPGQKRGIEKSKEDKTENRKE